MADKKNDGNRYHLLKLNSPRQDLRRLEQTKRLISSTIQPIKSLESLTIPMMPKRL
jgi:hypothetical protein